MEAAEQNQTQPIVLLFILLLKMLLNLSLNNSQFQESKRDQGPQDEMMDGAMEFRALCSATQVLSLDNDKVSWINLEVYNSRMTMD